MLRKHAASSLDGPGVERQIVSTEQIVAQAWSALQAALESPTEMLALGAAAAAIVLTITSSFVKTMVPLRWLAVCSNGGFLVYGLLHVAPVMALLHGTLLPINLYRLREMLRLTRRVKASARSADTSGIWLRPYMKSMRCKAGQMLFRKGDVADHLYFLADGAIELVEIGQKMAPGRAFGEVAFFVPSGRRTLSARCSEDSLVLYIDQSTVRELYYQNPDFGFELIGLVASRLSADVARLEEQIGRLKAAAEPKSAPTR